MNRDSAQLTVDDVRFVFRVVQGCLDSWADPAAWKGVLAEGVREIINGAESRGVGMLQLVVPGSAASDKPTMIPVAYTPWASAEAERRYLSSFESEFDLEMPNFADAARPALEGATSAFSRSMIIEDGVWEAMEFRRQYIEPNGLGEFAGAMRICEPLRTMAMLVGHRDHGAAPIPDRSVQQLGILAEEVVPLLGTRLTLEDQLNLGGLTERQRQTLELLLDGLSEKQVAAKLGVRPATVHDYVVQLHKYFGVSSRGELMSYFVKRRPRGAAESTAG